VFKKDEILWEKLNSYETQEGGYFITVPAISEKEGVKGKIMFEIIDQNISKKYLRYSLNSRALESLSEKNDFTTHDVLEILGKKQYSDLKSSSFPEQCILCHGGIIIGEVDVYGDDLSDYWDDWDDSSGGDDIVIIGGGSSGNTGNSKTPEKYKPRTSDVLSKPNLSTTMSKQLANTCVTSIMEYINHEICNGNINEGTYITDYLNTYNSFVFRDGVSLNNLNSFVSRHFNTSLFSSFSNSINNGQVVMTDIASSIPNSSHNVLVIGYQGNGNLIYMNPEKGSLQQADISKFNQNYAIPITNCK